MRFLVAAMVLTGCSGATGVASLNAPDVVMAPACAVDVVAPERFSDVLWHNDRRDVDCTQSAWGGAFEVGFSHGWLFHVEIPRQLNAPGVVNLDAGTLALYYFGHDGACVNWTGSIDWQDVPDWSVSIDAVCADDASKAVVGTWLGHR